MSTAISLAILAGLCSVVQAGLNKAISAEINLPLALIINSIFFMLSNVILFLIVFYFPKLTDNPINLSQNLQSLRWWWIFPGIIGFIIVFGITVAVIKIGATQAFIVTIASQIIAGLFWDKYVGGQHIPPLKMLGALITFIGATLTIFS